jgi:hypothetical protein
MSRTTENPKRMKHFGECVETPSHNNKPKRNRKPQKHNRDATTEQHNSNNTNPEQLSNLLLFKQLIFQIAAKLVRGIVYL